MTANIFHIIKERVLILDGAMGTVIQQYGLTEVDFRGARFADADRQMQGNNDMLCLTRPDVITDIHRGRTEIKGGLPRIVSDSLISEGTVGAPYLEEAENTLVHNSSHERLFRKNPAD